LSDKPGYPTLTAVKVVRVVRHLECDDVAGGVEVV
jgi:hypothetical protein